MAWGFKKAPEPVGDNQPDKPKADRPKIDERRDVISKHGAHDVHARGEAPPRRQK